MILVTALSHIVVLMAMSVFFSSIYFILVSEKERKESFRGFTITALVVLLAASILFKFQVIHMNEQLEQIKNSLIKLEKGK